MITLALVSSMEFTADPVGLRTLTHGLMAQTVRDATWRAPCCRSPEGHCLTRDRGAGCSDRSAGC